MFEYVAPTETKNLRASSRGRKDEKPVLQPVEPPTKDVTDSKKVDKKLNKNKKDNLRLRGVSKKNKTEEETDENAKQDLLGQVSRLRKRE